MCVCLQSSCPIHVYLRLLFPHLQTHTMQDLTCLESNAIPHKILIIFLTSAHTDFVQMSSRLCAAGLLKWCLHFTAQLCVCVHLTCMVIYCNKISIEINRKLPLEEYFPHIPPPFLSDSLNSAICYIFSALLSILVVGKTVFGLTWCSQTQFFTKYKSGKMPFGFHYGYDSTDAEKKMVIVLQPI